MSDLDHGSEFNEGFGQSMMQLLVNPLSDLSEKKGHERE